MDEQQQIPPQQTSSFMTRAAGIFMSPGETYAEVSTASDQSTSWVIPMILTILVSLLFSYTIFTNPSFKQQIIEAQRQAMQQKVEKGEMTQAERARAEQFMESSNIMLYSALVGSAVAPPVMLFCASLVLWLVARFALGSAAKYAKWLEVFGLSTLIGVVGAVVSLITMHLFNSVHATASGGLLLLSNYDAASFVHRLIAGISVFGVWQTAVVGIGMAKLSGKPTGTAMPIAFGLWLVIVLLSAATGFGSL
jgi:hypothetical protein